MRGSIDGPDDGRGLESASDLPAQVDLPSYAEAVALSAADDPYPSDDNPEPAFEDSPPEEAPDADAIWDESTDDSDLPPEDTDPDRVDGEIVPSSMEFGGFFRKLGLSGEPRSDSSPEGGEKPELAAEEWHEFLTGTFKNVLTGVVQLAADAHGTGLILRLARGAVTAVEWVQAAEDERGTGLDIPVLVGSLVEVDMSVHLGDDEGPPVTFCCSLTEDSPVGDLNIDGIVIGPGDTPKDEDPGEDGDAERLGPTGPLPVRREQAPGPPWSGARPTKVSETIDLVQEYVTPELLRRAKQRNRFAVWYSVSTFAIILFYLDGEANLSWQAVIWETDTHQLMMYVDRAGQRASKDQGSA